MSGVRVEPVEYLVTAWPEDLAANPDAASWCVTVSRRAPGLFGVFRGVGGKQCLGVDGEWDYEPGSDERSDDWKSAHRFPLDEALELAREWAPKVSMMGRTALECIAWHRKQEAADETVKGVK